MHRILRTLLLGATLAATCGMPSRSLAAESGTEPAAARASVPLRKWPLQELRHAGALVAGERLSAYWAEGDTLRPMVHARIVNGTWRLIRKPDPTANGRLRGDWRLPVDLSGPVEFKFSEPLSEKPLDSVRVSVVSPAGSPETGPVLDSALETASVEEQTGTNFIPYRSASALADLQARLTAAEGGSKCLPNGGTLRESARKDSRAFADALPILVSRVRYHYRDARTNALTAGEFRAAGFSGTVIASQRVQFMLDDAYFLSNFDDPIARIEIRVGGDTVIVRRNSQRAYTFTAYGMRTIFLKAFTAKGETWEQATVLEVPPADETPAGAEEERALAPTAQQPKHLKSAGGT